MIPVPASPHSENAMVWPMDEIEIARNAWDQDPGYTLWAVIQAFTYAANDKSLPAETAYKLQKIGGQILALVK